MHKMNELKEWCHKQIDFINGHYGPFLGVEVESEMQKMARIRKTSYQNVINKINELQGIDIEDACIVHD